MRKLFLLVVSLLLIYLTNAQQALRLKPRIYKTTVTTISPGSSASGYLASISDSSIYVSPQISYSAAAVTDNRSFAKMDYSNISQVQFRRKGATGKGILIGGAIGLAAGAVIGAASYTKPKDDFGQTLDDLFGISRATTTFAGGIFGTLAGGVVGAVVGALAKKTFIIGGKKDKFQTMRSKILY